MDLTSLGTGPGDGGDQYVGLDRFGRVVDQKWVNSSTSTTTDEFLYGYNRDGNVLYRDNSVNSAFGELYTYDTENQLASFQRGTLNSTKTGLTGSASHSQSFTPDALGNFSSVTTDGTAVTRTHNLQNEVTAVGASSLAFDSNGNLTTDQNGNTLKYDAWNQLVQAKAGSTVLDAYGYDATGRRITENPGTQRDLYYSDQWQVLEERVGGTAVDQNVWSPVYVDAMIERDSGSGLSVRLYTQVDANYNVTALVDTSGVVQERDVYDPFGVQTVLTPSWGSRSVSSYAFVYAHQGLRTEISTGLLYNREREFSSTLQRFLQPDPSRFGAGDVNFYRNESNNPSTLLDPSGLQVKPPFRPLLPEYYENEVQRIGEQAQKKAFRIGLDQSISTDMNNRPKLVSEGAFKSGAPNITELVLGLDTSKAEASIRKKLKKGGFRAIEIQKAVLIVWRVGQPGKNPRAGNVFADVYVRMYIAAKKGGVIYWRKRTLVVRTAQFTTGKYKTAQFFPGNVNQEEINIERQIWTNLIGKVMRKR